MQVRGAGHLYRPKYRTADGGVVKESGIWWWKCGKVRMSTGHRSEEDAQRWVIDRLVEMHRGHLVGARAKPLAWDDLERMLEDRWAVDGRRGMQQCQARLRHLRRAFAGWPAAAITTDRITTYALRRRAEGAAVGTVNLSLAILHRAFALAREAGLLDVVPVVHRLPGSQHRTGIVERSDLEAILALLPQRYRPVVRFLWLTGWREGEALGLTWQRVDLRVGEVRLDTSKTGEPRRLHFGADSPLHRLPAAQAAADAAQR